MPLHLNIKKKLVTKTERVKSVDLHPTETWVLSSLYSGKVVITNYVTNGVVKSFDVSDLPVRVACFIVRKQWIICGADDMRITVYNYQTLDKVTSFEAHTDYIRSIAVHPSQPFILSSSDDMTIKLWNWEQGWKLNRTFEGHTHYTMHCAFNPKDHNVFATASMDQTVKVWNINSSKANVTLEGHTKGVNYVDFYWGADKPYLITSSDDFTAKVWDYQTKACIQTLEGHSNNVSVCCFHPKLPVIITGGEDGQVIIWNSSTYKVEQSIYNNMERIWAIAYSRDDTKVALGYDEGTVVFKLGKEDPIVSMDDKGKIIMAIHNEIQQITIKSSVDSTTSGELKTTVKDLGALELYPVSIQHDPSSRYIAVCGDGDFVIKNAASWTSKIYGEGEMLVWGPASGQYAVKQGGNKIKIFKDFKEYKTLKTSVSSPEEFYGGVLLGVKGKGFLYFYDWDTLDLLRSIEVSPKMVYWNDDQSLIISCEDSFFVLTYNKKLITDFYNSNKGASIEDGVEDCLTVDREVNEKIRDGQWIGDDSSTKSCFIFTNYQNKILYLVGGELITLAQYDKTSYFLGYVPKNQKVYMMEKDQTITAYSLSLAMVHYETAIINGDLEAAAKLLPQVPKENYVQLARFLDNQGQKQLAMAISPDVEHRFELAIELNLLKEAYEIAKNSQDAGEQKWRQLGTLALGHGDFKLAEECLKAAKDYNGLLLLYSSLSDMDGMKFLAEVSEKDGKNSLAFLSNFLIGNVAKCLELLLLTNRFPEAAFFAKTYMPIEVSRIVKLWKQQVPEIIADRIADPLEFPNLFPGFEETLQGNK